MIIAAAYEKWGERCPEKLLGDFAFSIWDGRKNMLFCARDPIWDQTILLFLRWENISYGLQNPKQFSAVKQ